MESKEVKEISEKYVEMYKNNQLAFEFIKEKNYTSEAYEQVNNALDGKGFIIDGKSFDDLDNLSETDYLSLMNYLLKLLQETDDPALIDKIKKMIAKIYKQSSKNETDEKKSPAKETKNETYAKTESDLPKQKAKNYGEYARQQLTGTVERPTIKTDTSKFETLTDDQLLACYSNTNFYKLSKKEQLALLQTSVNRYLDDAGVSLIPIEFDRNMTLDDRFVEYGCYKPNRQTIYINDNLFNNIDQNAENAFLPLKLLSTIIHEARHHVQFSKFIDNPTNKAEQLIQKSMQQNQADLSFKEYLSSPDELDARNAALEYMRNAAIVTKNIDMAAFYNSEKRNEQNNKKGPASQTMMNACPDIYNKQIKFDINSYYVSRIREQQSSCVNIASGLYMATQKYKK